MRFVSSTQLSFICLLGILGIMSYLASVKSPAYDTAEANTYRFELSVLDRDSTWTFIGGTYARTILRGSFSSVFPIIRPADLKLAKPDSF